MHVGRTWVLVVVEKEDLCRDLFVTVALLDPSRKLWVTPHLLLQTLFSYIQIIRTDTYIFLRRSLDHSGQF